MLREQLRDFFAPHQLGLILIGMPGLEKRLARYPQLYSRVAFAHQYRPLSAEELAFVLQRHSTQIGQSIDADDFTDTEAIVAVACITGGNFRLIERLFSQVQRVLEINQLRTITREVPTSPTSHKSQPLHTATAQTIVYETLLELPDVEQEQLSRDPCP